MFATEVTAIIEDVVCGQHKDLVETKRLIFQNLNNGESPHVADVKLVENCFIKTLTDCARIEFENKFQQSCNNKDFVDRFTRLSNKISTINDLLGLCEAGVYATQLELYSNLMDELDLASFIANLKVYVWKVILEKSTSDQAELQVLQCLVACFQANVISPLVHKKLKEFKDNCESQPGSAYSLKELMEDVKIERNSAPELRTFLESIKSLKSDHSFLKSQLPELVRFYLKPVEITIKTIGTRSIVEVVGGIIYMSQQLQEIQRKISDNSQNRLIDECRVIAVHMLEIDCDLENSCWYGINIFVMATNVNVSKKCKWDLSGLPSQKRLEKAKSSSTYAKDGTDGIDGHAGESSGNVMIVADQIQNAEWLTVILNGGSGANGQDGGDGTNGKDGQGISMNDLKEKFPSPVHFWGRLHNLAAIYNKICSMGKPQVKWAKGTNCYVELKLDNGQEIIHSASRYLAGNCYLLYKGSLGQYGGHGGLNGLGGEGGYQGECIAISKQNQPFPVTVETTKGSDGQDGKPGRNGEYGKNGWDVGYVDFQNWSSISEYGGDQKQRLRMDYSIDSSDRVYCGYQYDERGSSMCYATIKASTLQHRKLTESEKSREKCTGRQRKQQAVATRKSAMQQSAMTKLYDRHFENGNHLLNGILQMNVDATINFDMMQRKAKTAFEEVDKLKERSREKVSRYQVYEADKKMKKVAADTTTKSEISPEQRKSQILSKIKNNTQNDDSIWKKLFTEEFSQAELGSVETKLHAYVTNRQIETPEIRRMQQKLGLTKFQNNPKNDYLLLNTSEMNKYHDLNIEKYLQIHEESKSGLQRILQYQKENERIQDAFDELLQYRVSTTDFHTTKKYYHELISMKIGAQTLVEFLENVDETDEQAFAKASEKLFELKFNQNEWKKFLKMFNCLKMKVQQTEKLKHFIPISLEEVPIDNQNLLKHLLDLYKQLRSVTIANCILANLVELFISEHQESKNNPIRVQKCLELHKIFLENKQKSIEKIHQTVQFLSQRPKKASWRHSHEYPNFLAPSDIEEELDINEKLLRKLYNLYLIKQNENMDWHPQTDNQMLAMCLKKMKADKLHFCAPLFELIGWKHQLNIKVYCQDDSRQFTYVREHYNFSKQVLRILIQQDQTIEHLVINQEFVNVGMARKNLISKFQSERQYKRYFPFDDIEDSNDDVIIYKLCEFFPEDDQNKLEDRLKKLSAQFIGKNSILSSLLYCFMCNGCHLHLNEIFVLVNTILECSIHFDQDPELFTSLILSYRQSQLIDEVILIQLENLIRKRLQNKETLRSRLMNIKNHSIKLILATKLEISDSIIDEEFFSNMLTLLPYIKEDSIFLEQLKLSEWSLALKKSYWQHGLTDGGGLNFKDESLEQCSFYLVKLENSYSRELVENLVKVLNETKHFSTETLLIFVHRFYADDTELCTDILDDFAILNSKLSNLFQNSNRTYSGKALLELCQRNQNCPKKDFDYLKHLMIKLGLLTSEDRNMEDLIQIIEKSPHHNEMTKHLSKIDELFKRMENGENPILKYVIDDYNRQHAAEDSDDFRPEQIIYERCCSDEKDFKKIVEHIRSEMKTIKRIKNCDFYLLDIVNRGIKLKRGFSLRATQKLVVMLTLMNEKNLLTQVATGEGKTLIIATLCIIKCLYGEKIDIVTSCSVLAKRDAESEPPKGNMDLYALFGIHVGHICSEDIDQRIQVFNNCDVIYGDLSSFQRDYLLDRFYAKNILGTRVFENVIVDEVDSMLLDNGNNMLYLSHDIPNMDKLQSLYIFLWESVNQPIKSMEDLKNFYDNSAIKQSVIADLYGMVMHDEVEDDVWKKLTESETIGQDGRLLINQNDYTQLVKTFSIPQAKTKNRLIFLLNSINARQRHVKIPKDLYVFVERHLDRFIDNAKHALFMSVGVDYVIDVDRTGLDPDLNPKIIIIDKNTGTDQSSSQWHEGLHQFLQIKHGCKLSLMSLKAVFISNVSYLKLYRNLYGLSGTLGSTQEKELLNELYNVDLVKIPTSKPKNFFEERSIISGYKEQWIENIYTATKTKLLKGRSVLIIGETVKDVDYITKNLIKRVTEHETSDSNQQMRGTLKDPYVYKREHDEFVFGQGNEYLSCGKVIVATNLAGRGTDIKLKEELVKAGGLHVILTFLPANCRVEEQAYGRAARCGEKGSGQLIVIGNEEDGGSYSSKIFQLKNARDVDELQRLKMVKKFYDERITIEENCFKSFKDKYEKLRRMIEQNEDIKKMTKLLLDSFLDHWAFWLDENSSLIENHAIHLSKKNELSKSLEDFLEPISICFDDWLNSPSQFLKLGNHYIKTKEYEKAKRYFEKIIAKDSYYLAEALYYSSAVLIKQKNVVLLNKTGSAFQQLKRNLVRAKNLFEERINDCSNHQAIVESFKKKETNILIHIEAFSEQQKTISQIYNLFINSIDDILGHSASYTALINYELNEILAYDAFIELQRQGIVTRPTSNVTDSDNVLTDITIEYGISKAVLQTYLQDNRALTSESIGKVIHLPNVEEFWLFLKEAKVITDEVEFIVVNKKKLELIESSKITNLISTNKIDKSLKELKPIEILQYPIGVEEENSFCSMTLYSKLELLDRRYLEERGVCSVNRKANINPKEIAKEQEFSKFDSLKLSDITRLKIADDEAIMILESLSQQKVNVLEERSNGTYKLKDHINCSSLPSCYQHIIAALLNSIFVYRLAYMHLQEYYQEIQEASQQESNLKFQFRLTSNPYQRLIFDLMDKSVIQDSYVIYEKVKSADFKKIFGNFKSSLARHLDHLTKEENLDFISKSLNQLCCGIEKFETPDCFFSSLEGTLKAQQNSAVVEASWFSLNGMEDVIVLQEQTYSWKFWRNVIIVTTMALAQIAVGALIEIWSAGVGTYAASFIINEGISDLFFVTGCLWHGHMTMSSYWEHKKWSMAISAVSCGVGALWSRGTKLSRIGYKVAGPVRAEGGKKVAEMVGTELFKSVSVGRVGKETLKRVGCKLIEGAAYGFAQGAVDHVITNHLHGLCNTVQKTLVADVDELFRNHKLNETICEAFNTMGEQQTQLLMSHVTRECFEKIPLYTAILAHCTRLCGSITRGISEGMRKVSTAGSATPVSTMMAILMNLQPLLRVCGALDEMRKMRDSAENFLQNANKMIQDAIAEHKSSGTSITAPLNVQVLRDQTMQQWKQTIIETSNQVIATHVLGPILSYGTNLLVGFIGNSIKKQYHSYKEEKYREEFESLKKSFDENVKNAKLNAEEHQKEVKTYHETLIKLMGKTKDAKLFSNILRENVPMDMTCVQACTNVLDQCMRCLKTADGETVFTGIRIVIEVSDGSSHEYSSSTDPSHTISLTLDDNHFRVHGYENIETSQNSCLYEALISQVPELKTVFSDGKAFREHLSDYIEHDKSLQYTIAQGWHRFAIKKGSYGGAIKEENYDQGVLYSKHVLTIEEALKKIYNGNPNLSEEIREKIKKCLDDIDNIATGDLQSGHAANDIDTVVENFNKWLNSKLKNDQLRLRNELKKTISTFRERVIQTVRENYLITVEEFRTQALRADRSPIDPNAVHVADRVDFARDDIEMKSLVNNSTKARNDPNIIASVIHAKLNKDVPESERRYNTVIVGIHKEAVYIAFNQVGIVNGQETYEITDEQCEKICRHLASKDLLVGRYKVIFLGGKFAPTDRVSCRAPHGEMQIMRCWKNAGILQEDNMMKKGKPWSIGGSKPACFCCSAAMKTHNVDHKVYGKANMSPKNWVPFADIRVKIKMIWNVQTESLRQ